jgi:hypothetical protein
MRYWSTPLRTTAGRRAVPPHRMDVSKPARRDQEGRSKLTMMTSDPVASVSGQFPLARPKSTPPQGDEPSELGVRPWALTHLRSANGTGSSVLGAYSHELQVMITADGSPVVDSGLRAGDPSADTTATVDGEDGPSSEDWDNDFAPEDPLPA